MTLDSILLDLGAQSAFGMDLKGEGGLSIAGRVRVQPSTQDPGLWVPNSRSRVLNSGSWDHGLEGRGFWVVGWWVVGW